MMKALRATALSVYIYICSWRAESLQQDTQTRSIRTSTYGICRVSESKVHVGGNVAERASQPFPQFAATKSVTAASPANTHTHSKNSSAHCLHRLNRCRALNAVLSFLPSKSSTHKIRAVCVGFRRFCRWTLRTLLLASDASTDTVAYKLDGFARDINQDTINSWTVNTYQLHQSEWRISGIILSKPQPICP